MLYLLINRFSSHTYVQVFCICFFFRMATQWLFCVRVCVCARQLRRTLGYNQNDGAT